MPLPVWLKRAATALHLHDRKRVLGLAFIFAVAVIWVAASFIVQGLQETGVSPAVLTLIANSLFSIYLPIYFLNLRLQRTRAAAQSHMPLSAEQDALYPCDKARSDAAGGHNSEHEASLAVAPTQEDSKEAARGMSRRQIFNAALIVAPLWYLAQFTFNLSLSQTSITSNTILSSTSSLFTFLFSVWLLHEVFTLRKLLCIGLLIAGTAMVTLADTQSAGSKSEAERSLLGNMLCVLSAVIYGAYTVGIRRLLSEDEDTPMTLFFGFMGALILLTVGPLLGLAALLHAPLGTLSLRQLGMVVAKGLLDNVLSDYLWARAILLVGPTIATGGLSMQVPLAVALDAALRSPAWLHSAGPAVLTVLGAVVVLAGFLGLNTTEGDDEAGRAQQWDERQAALQTELGVGEEEEDGEELFPPSSPTGAGSGGGFRSRSGSPMHRAEEGGDGGKPISPELQDRTELKGGRSVRLHAN